MPIRLSLDLASRGYVNRWDYFCSTVPCTLKDSTLRGVSSLTFVHSPICPKLSALDTAGYSSFVSPRRQQDLSSPTSLSGSSITAGASPTEVERASVIVAVQQRRDRGESPPAKERNTVTHYQEHRDGDRQRDFRRSFRASSRSSRDMGDTETFPSSFPHRQQASLNPTSLHCRRDFAHKRGRGIGRACGGATQR